VGQPFDGFNTPNVTIAPDVSFGSVELTQGPHQLMLIIPGKNAASTGYFAGIDLLRLTKTD
jgi:D-arabinan exo alpha-(1,3)/(1,5)-arabinofuranosidase (non-reducing end)